LAIQWSSQDNFGVDLLSKKGELVVRLHRFFLDNALSEPGAVILRRRKQAYALWPRLSRLKRIQSHIALRREKAFGLRVTLPILPSARFPGSETGSWEWSSLAPNGNMILGQWRRQVSECSDQVSYFIPIEGEDASPVTGVASAQDAPKSIALGWTRNGRAMVYIPRYACGDEFDRPGIYAFAAPGIGSLIVPEHGIYGVRMWGPSSAPSPP
jgi:hypothetical protein